MGRQDIVGQWHSADVGHLGDGQYGDGFCRTCPAVTGYGVSTWWGVRMW